MKRTNRIVESFSQHINNKNSKLNENSDNIIGFCDMDWALDTANPKELAETFQMILDAVDKYNVIWAIIEGEGPGGGWPVCRVEGNKKDVLSFYNEFGFENDIIEEYWESN